MKVFTFLLSIFFLLHSSSAKFEWRFEIDNLDLLVFNISVGTPSQKIQVGMFHLGFYHPLRFQDAKTSGGIFDPTASSTWQKMKDSVDANGTVNGVVGTDSMIINNFILPKSQPFEVISGAWSEFPGFGTFTPSRSSDGTLSFAEKLLESERDKVVTFVYDPWTDVAQSVGLTGMLVVGGRAPKRCADSKWTMFKEAVYKDRPYEQWTVNIAKIKVGKYSFSKPGQLSFQLNDAGLGLPATTYDSVMKALGSNDGTHVPCDTKVHFVFTLDHDFALRINPVHYVIKGDDGSCTVRINRLDQGVNGFIFPSYFFNNHCLLLDYTKNHIGITSRAS